MRIVQGFSALIASSAQGHLDTVQVLVEHKANLELKETVNVLILGFALYFMMLSIFIFQLIG